MSASKRQPTCDEISLDVLLFGDEDSGEFRASSTHVESGARRQDRLCRMAVDQSDWSEVRKVLGPDEMDSEGDELSGGTNQPGGSRGTVPRVNVRRSLPTARRFTLDFLAPPSH